MRVSRVAPSLDNVISFQDGELKLIMNLKPMERPGNDIKHMDAVTLHLFNKGTIVVNSQITTYDKAATLPNGGSAID